MNATRAMLIVYLPFYFIIFYHTTFYRTAFYSNICPIHYIRFYYNTYYLTSPVFVLLRLCPEYKKSINSSIILKITIIITDLYLNTISNLL
jgi:hypothetical protein